MHIIAYFPEQRKEVLIMSRFEEMNKAVNEFNAVHNKQEDYTLDVEICDGFFRRLYDQPANNYFNNLVKLYDYGFMQGYNQAQKEYNRDYIRSIINNISDHIDKLEFLSDNLECVRISLKGNDEVIPSTNTIDSALYSVYTTMEILIEKMRDILD